MSPSTPKPGGLRERKRQRTRDRIIHVAIDLFSERGYQTTTLAQIAEAAEIAPSTLYAYFPSKEDIVFSEHPGLRDSIRSRIVERPGDETLSEAMLAWVSNVVPERILAGGGMTLMRRRRAIIDDNDDLLAAERLRLALLEDVFAEAFASEFDESPADLRARLMAALATNGLRTIWQWWYPQSEDEDDDPHELSQLDAVYLIRLLDAAQLALEAIPKPQLQPHHRTIAHGQAAGRRR
jgi:AcrR family transcriptional regulator